MMVFLFIFIFSLITGNGIVVELGMYYLYFIYSTFYVTAHSCRVIDVVFEIIFPLN